MNRRSPVVTFAVALLLAAGSVAGQAADAGEARLRNALRDALLQLRTVQEEVVVVRSEMQAMEEENAALRKRLEATVQQLAAEQEAARAAAGALREEISQKEGELERMLQTLLECRRESDALGVTAESRARELVQAGEERAILRRDFELLRSQNRELHRIAVEILERYENFSLGRALAAREPFTGSARARLKAALQDYRDAIDDQRVRLADVPEAEPMTRE